MQAMVARFSAITRVHTGSGRPLTNFYLAGDYTASDYPATLESAVRSGVACARHILRQT